jgi:hypothetical protein
VTAEGCNGVPGCLCARCLSRRLRGLAQGPAFRSLPASEFAARMTAMARAGNVIALRIMRDQLLADTEHRGQRKLIGSEAVRVAREKGWTL